MDANEIKESIGAFMPMLEALGIKLLTAIVIFVVGKWLAGLVKNLCVSSMKKRSMDTTITGFIGNMIYGALLAFVIIAVLGQLGVQTASFVAIVGAAGLAIGLALQGSLSNFAAGVLMVVFRPCRVGDYISAAGVEGTVADINIFATRLTTPDNKNVILPNSAIMDGVVTNYTSSGTRRIDMTFGVGYEADIKQAKEVIAAVLAADDRILTDPAPMVAVSELADSSVNFVARPWCKTADYWGVFFDTNEKVKDALDSAGISIPFPQVDVHLDKS